MFLAEGAETRGVLLARGGEWLWGWVMVVVVLGGGIGGRGGCVVGAWWVLVMGAGNGCWCWVLGLGLWEGCGVRRGEQGGGG